MYKPKNPFITPAKLLFPTYIDVKGTAKKLYPPDGNLIWCSFKTYGGTESDVNGLHSIRDTAVVETWFRPDIAADCAIMLADTGAVYEIIGEPENIEMRNQYCIFKVERVKGGA